MLQVLYTLLAELMLYVNQNIQIDSITLFFNQNFYGCISSFLKNLYITADDPKKVDHLRSLDGAKERLHLLPANLLEEGSFDAAVEGCEGVFHTASPFFNDTKDPEV